MADPQQLETLKKIATQIRYHILTMSTQAGSGHPTSSLSATDLMTGLLSAGSSAMTAPPGAPQQ